MPVFVTGIHAFVDHTKANRECRASARHDLGAA